MRLLWRCYQTSGNTIHWCILGLDFCQLLGVDFRGGSKGGGVIDFCNWFWKLFFKTCVPQVKKFVVGPSKRKKTSRVSVSQEMCLALFDKKLWHLHLLMPISWLVLSNFYNKLPFFNNNLQNTNHWYCLPLFLLLLKFNNFWYERLVAFFST